MMEQKLKPIDVWVINDSNYMRKFITDIITSDDIHVSNYATDGHDALQKLSVRKPDVILLDLEMPKMDGLTFIEKMTESGNLIPTIIVSNFSKDGTKMVLDALETGAVDFVQLSEESDKDKLREILHTKIKIANNSDPTQLILEKISSLRPKHRHAPKIGTSELLLIIGASTGGPNTVQRLLSELPANMPCGILLVQHMPKGFTTQFASRLERTSGFIVKEAQEGDIIKDGHILLAPGDYHMIVQQDRKIHLDSSEKRFGVRPSVNMTMVSASEVYGASIVGVILTGMGHDGAFGMKTIKKRGGHTIVQDEKTCVIYGMPKAVVDLNAADHILPIDKIANKIAEEIENLV